MRKQFLDLDYLWIWSKIEKENKLSKPQICCAGHLPRTQCGVAKSALCRIAKSGTLSVTSLALPTKTSVAIRRSIS